MITYFCNFSSKDLEVCRIITNFAPKPDVIMSNEALKTKQSKAASPAKKRSAVKTVVPKDLIIMQKDSKMVQPLTVAMMRSGAKGSKGFSILQHRAVVATMAKLQDVIQDLRRMNLGPDKMNLQFEDLCHSIDGIDIKEGYQVKINFTDFGVSKNNYPDLKDALMSLREIPVNIPQKTATGEDYIEGTNLCNVWVKDGLHANYVVLVFKKSVLNLLVNTDFGVQFVTKPFLLAYSKGVYSVKLYYLINQFKDAGKLEIFTSTFRQRMEIVDKYPRFDHVVNKILEPVKNELKEQAQMGQVDCYFDWKPLYSGRSKRGEPEKICFTIYKTRVVLPDEVLQRIANMKKQFVTFLTNYGVPESFAQRYSMKIDEYNYEDLYKLYENIGNRLFGYDRKSLPPVRDKIAYIRACVEQFFDDDTSIKEGEIFTEETL